MKKFLILYLALNFFVSPVFAVDFDLSVDDEIRRNYNPSKLEEDTALPALPSILKPNQTTIQPPSPTTNTLPVATSKPPVQSGIQKAVVQKPAIKPQQNKYTKPTSKIIQANFATLKKGTKIKVKLLTNLSDRTKRGTKISFASTYPVSTTYFTIPSGTIFQGEIINSHKPQFTGNGGLLVININSAILNDSTQPINAYVTKANRKKIFFNNIKGKRRYTKSLAKSIKPGCRFFTKMMRVTSNLASDGSSIILTPFSVTAGIIGLGANAVISPVIAVFKKGDPLNLPYGCDFEIKLSQDIFIYN